MFDLKKNERPLMDEFADSINFRCYKYKDQDTGAARPLSEWDLFLAANCKAVFIEGKKGNNWLTEAQRLASLKAEKSNCKYYVLVFGASYKDNILLTDREKFYHVEGLVEILDVLKSDLYDI